MGINFGILGAGLIGAKRATAIVEAGGTVSAIFDPQTERAQKLAQDIGAKVFPSAEALVGNPDIHAVIIATTNRALAPSALLAAKHKKHLLIEKPGGKNPLEIREWIWEAKRSGIVCGVGFNHRFHPAIQKAKRLFEKNEIGPLLYFRARYGHGGRLGYEKEWRADPQWSGGGELIDQGVHLIDLCRWFGGEFEVEFGHTQTLFWSMPVEDNAFLLLRSRSQKQLAFLHASCTEWKNTFDFEVFGNQGKLQVTGLGRSYGPEELKHFKMKPERGVPLLEQFSFPEEDISWREETKAFLAAIRGEKTDLANADDALRAVEIVYDVYEKNGAVWI